MKKEFTSPTKGPMSFNQVFADIMQYVAALPAIQIPPDHRYRFPEP
ncbi:MAG: hypothetical protein ACOX3A_08445 [bacterium]